jgi:hypothetical protein
VAPGFIPVEVVLEPLEDGEERHVGTIVLERGETLHGRIMLPDGSPVACARVLVDDPTSPPRPGFGGGCGSHTAVFYDDLTGDVTDADGTFEVSGLGAGPYSLIVEHRGNDGVARAQRMHQVWPSPAELRIALERPPRVSGVVRTAAGAPYSHDLQVWAHSDEPEWRDLCLSLHETKTGRYVFDDLFPGRWRIGVREQGYRSWSAVVELAAADLELDVRLEAESSVQNLDR